MGCYIKLPHCTYLFIFRKCNSEWNNFTLIFRFLKFAMFYVRGLIKNRQYGDIVMPLQGITEVINHFTDYKDIPQIEQLSAEVIF